ncbi:efflux RND transporter periplasmic adaptor subunit [Pseudoduganella sp. FT55W]|uniref:Efflux RND transporter periplasmic adaptor subunit n=1 Tax=Duganella rivi TaxID=2666083 RepID=A0A7X4GM25_9BURK|nr:efflux RND transporter periplasmic adaptor subunit [Duganella rivi]MYM65982.1 efflux RND transporter periplasmic adaptor subunit [Duganella rivi]
MSRKALIILPVAALVLAAWGISTRLQARDALAQDAASGAVINVVVAKPVHSTGGDELVLPGSVQAQTEATIYARTSGYLKAWHPDIGASVKKGELLAEIDTPEIDQQLRQASADLATAQANYALANTTSERWKGLLATQSVSAQDADQKLGDAQAKKAAVDAAAANVARLRDLESFKRVVAPFDGVITARRTDTGALINGGQSAGSELFRLADTRKLRIYVQLPGKYAALAKPGLPAELRFDERPGKKYEAQAVRTSRALDPVSRTLQVELALDNADGELFPGAYVEVHFKFPDAAETVRLPANTVLFRSAGLQVATVGADNRVKLKSIKQGRDFGATIEVLDGLTANDVVILNPPDSLVDGATVKTTPQKVKP